MKGKFKLDDLREALIEKDVYDKDEFDRMLLELPSTSWFSRKPDSKPITYKNSINIVLIGYHDESGSDILLENNEHQRPEEWENIPSIKRFTMKFAYKHNVEVNPENLFFRIIGQINDLEELSKRIEDIKSIERKFSVVIDGILEDYANRHMNSIKKQ